MNNRLNEATKLYFWFPDANGDRVTGLADVRAYIWRESAPAVFIAENVLLSERTITLTGGGTYSTGLYVYELAGQSVAADYGGEAYTASALAKSKRSFAMRFIGQGVEADVTPTRAANLDNLAVAPNTVTPNNSGITTLIDRLTAARALYLDHLATAPATPGAAMTLTSAYDAAKTALSASSYTAPDNASALTAATNSTTLLARLGAFTGTGVNTVLGLFRALARKDATLPTDIGGTFAVATDSLEAQAETVAAIKAQTDRITGATIYANNPVSADGGTLTLVTDNDYTAAHARPASWTDTNTALTGAVVSLKLPKADGTFTSITGTATAITGGFTLSFDVTRAQVTTTVSGYGYILATWAADSQQATPIRHIVVDRQAVA